MIEFTIHHVHTVRFDPATEAHLPAWSVHQLTQIERTLSTMREELTQFFTDTKAAVVQIKAGVENIRNDINVTLANKIAALEAAQEAAGSLTDAEKAAMLDLNDTVSSLKSAVDEVAAITPEPAPPTPPVEEVPPAA